jgi:hypothetical protein
VIRCARWPLAIGCVLAATLACREPAGVEAGFWFEHVAFESARLGGPLSSDDMTLIGRAARAELVSAFQGLPITFTDRRDTRYRVSVVQEVFDPRFRRRVGSAGESRAVSWIGGAGSVSFSFLAGGAVSYAPLDARRATIVEAIGRGIGRTAVHEFTHQLLPTAPIHDSRNVRSYEFASAARAEQYYGPMEWDLAWPLLQRRIGHERASLLRP